MVQNRQNKTKLLSLQTTAGILDFWMYEIMISVSQVTAYDKHNCEIARSDKPVFYCNNHKPI